MKKINSLILLINSLSKAEKKSIYLHSNLTKGKKVYMELFELVDKQKIVDSDELQQQFNEQFSDASFHPVAKYLYEFILNILVKIKTSQDKEYILFQKLLNAKVLLERNLDSDYHATLQQLQVEAKETSNYNLLLAVKRMELDFLRTTGFDDINEKILLQKQNKTRDTLKILRQINEQSSLYELLMLRIQQTPPSQFKNQKQFLDDLVVSEISLVSNLSQDVFEIQKLHQLFQAHYLIYVGDYKSALNSFIELDKLFGENKVQWNNPPLYYARVLEGILASLLAVREYDKMSYFLQKLNQLEHPSLSFQTEITCIRFIYRVAPLLIQGENSKCLQIIDEYKSSLVTKTDLLTPYRYLQLSLYLSSIYVVNKKVELARKQMTRIINSGSYGGLSLFRPIQLLNLIIHYELRNFDIITSRIRSIKRQNRIQKRSSRLEKLLFHFLSLDCIVLSDKRKETERQYIIKEYTELVDYSDHKLLLSILKLDQWMLSHLK